MSSTRRRVTSKGEPMRKWRGTWVALAAVAVLTCLVLAGTSSGNSGKASAPKSATGGPVTINFWQQKFEDYQQAWFIKYVKAFNKSQNKIKVNYLTVPADTWQQKLKAAQAAGTQPDVATTNYGAIPAGVVDGQFASLDGLLPASTFADIKSNVKSFVTIGGKHYAYPMLVEPSTVPRGTARGAGRRTLEGSRRRVGLPGSRPAAARPARDPSAATAQEAEGGRRPGAGNITSVTRHPRGKTLCFKSPPEPA